MNNNFLLNPVTHEKDKLKEDQNNNFPLNIVSEVDNLFLKLEKEDQNSLLEISEVSEILQKLKNIHNNKLKCAEDLLNVQKNIVKAFEKEKEFMNKLKCAEDLLNVQKNIVKAFEKEKEFTLKSLENILNLWDGNHGSIHENTFSDEVYVKLKSLYDILKMGIYAKMSSENKQMVEFILSTSAGSFNTSVLDVSDHFETSFEEIKGNISNSITITPKLFKSFLSSEDPCPEKRKTDNSLNDSTRRKSLKFTDCKVNELADIIEENETEMLNIFPGKYAEVTFEDIQTDRCRNSTFIKDISLVLGDNCTSFSEDHKSHVQWEKDQVTPDSTIIKSPFRSLKNVSGFIENRRDARKHNFVLKKGKITKRFCSFCDKKIYTKEKCYKCQTCNSVCHEDCSDALPIPCVPMVVFSEKLKIESTTIADHTPRTSPMVPALIVYCTIEIENRGLDSKGIYRTSGAQKDVVRLKNHFLKGEGVPNLKKEDINVLCSTIKNFLHSLKEPLITLGVRKDFENAIDKPEIEMCPALMQCVSEMPQPNRDTLAWMMRHLKRVCEVEENKMNVDNICTVFAPTLIDHYLNVKETGNLRIKEENNRGIKLVKALMSLEYDYWGSLLQGKENPPSTVSSPLSLNFSRTSWKRRSYLLWPKRK